jgi:hypothetical protein
MAYSSADARRQLLDSVAAATSEIGLALALLGEAYEHLDEQTAERLEQELFAPMQLAYGRAQRTHAEFAARSGLPHRAFEAAPPPAPSHGVRELLDGAVQAAGRADASLATLQDSMLPVEVGDPALRAGLEEVRRLLDGLRVGARELMRTLGR